MADPTLVPRFAPSGPKIPPDNFEDHKVRVSATDTTADFLFSKLDDGSNVSTSIVFVGGNEKVRITVSGAPPTGAAGGDLDGTYPNPTVVAIEETGDPARLSIGAIPDGTLLSRSGGDVIGISTTAVGDHQVLIELSDTTPGYLTDKLGPGANITFSVINPGANEKIIIAATVPPGSSDHKVLVDGADTTAAFLGAKLSAGSNVAITVLNPGTNEQVQIAVAGAPPTGVAGGDLGGTYPNPTVIALEETSGPTRLAIAGIANGTLLQRSGATIIGISTTAVGDHKVLVDGSDTTAAFLGAKLSAGSNVTLTVLSPGANERVQIAVAGAPPTGVAGGDLGGTYPNPTVIALEETSGPTRLAIAGIASGTLLQRSGTTIVGVSTTAVGDHKVLVDGSDTTAAFLGAKLSAGSNVALTILSPGGNELVQIAVAGAPPTGVAGGDLGGTYPNPTVVAIEETSGPTRLAIAGIASGTLLQRSGATIVGISTTAVGDHKVLVDGADTTAAFLEAKLNAGTNVTLTVLGPGGNEQVQISVAGAPPTGAAGGDLGGTYPNPTVVAIEETSSPARLSVGAIPAGSLLARSGTTVAGIVGSLGAVLIHDGTQFQPITYGSFNINTDASQAPTVAQGSTFFVDATALSINRNILPSTTGAAERQSITFIVTVPTSGGGFFYNLVADITVALSSKLIVQCVFMSGAWQIASFQPYQGTL